MHNIVVLGGNFAGSSTAHYLLRHVLPSLNSSSPKPQYKVILVSASTHTYYKVSAPRALFSDEILPPSKLFASIADGFSGYDPSVFEFVHGEAVGIDEAAKRVLLKPSSGEKLSVVFNSLVIATGSTSTSNLWSMPGGDHKETVSAFEDLHRRFLLAKSVMVVGGGAVGVESAGEIAFRGKDVTLLTGGKGLLMKLKHRGVGIRAEEHLRSLGAKVIYETKLVSSTKLPGGGTEVVLSDGSKRVVDVLVDCTGLFPNTSFVPSNWLNDKKYVATDGTTLRATQAPEGVYSIGDVASYSIGSVPDAQWCISALGYSIWSDLRKDNMVLLKEKKYKQFQSDMQIVPVGPKGGAGVLFGWRIPSFLVWLLKGRTMLIENAPGLATGSQVLKA